jgi:hypothetical protein
MIETIGAPAWQTVGLAVDQNVRDFLAGNHSLTENSQAWLKSVDLFRETQDDRMILRDPSPADLRQHKTWIAGLIAEGERLLTNSLASNPSTSASFLEATLELLYLWQREWHGPKMSDERRRELLKTVFDVEESAA